MCTVVSGAVGYLNVLTLGRRKFDAEDVEVDVGNCIEDVTGVVVDSSIASF